MARGIKTGGRRAGTPNKATLEIKEAARSYAPEALDMLYQIMKNGETDTAKITAAREILDRAYGKSTQDLHIEPSIVVEMPTIKIGGKNFNMLTGEIG